MFLEIISYFDDVRKKILQPSLLGQRDVFILASGFSYINVDTEPEGLGGHLLSWVG